MTFTSSVVNASVHSWFLHSLSNALQNIDCSILTSSLLHATTLLLLLLLLLLLYITNPLYFCKNSVHVRQKKIIAKYILESQFQN